MNSLTEIFMIALPGPELSPEVKEALKTLKIKNFIFFRRHISSREQFLDLLSQLEKISQGGLRAVDQEGGPVVRLSPPLAPSLKAPLELAQGPSPEKTVAQEAKICLKILRTFGLNFNLAPVLDLADETAPPYLQARTFGKDPSLVACFGRIYIQTFQTAGVLCCAKHFPGLGGVEVDPHRDLPRVARLSEEALYPFAEAIRAGVPAIMTTHLLVEALSLQPVTFSPEIIKLLRHRLGFKGPILTDDLDMGAIAKRWPLPEALTKALLAGHDLLLICQDFWRAIKGIEEFLKEVAQSPRLRARAEEAAWRVKGLRSYSGVA